MVSSKAAGASWFLHLLLSAHQNHDSERLGFHIQLFVVYIYVTAFIKSGISMKIVHIGKFILTLDKLNNLWDSIFDFRCLKYIVLSLNGLCNQTFSRFLRRFHA